MPADYEQQHVGEVGVRGSASRAPRFILFVLIAAGVLPPLAFALLPNARVLVMAPLTAALPAIGLALVPALVGAALIWRGAGKALTRIGLGRRGEQRQALVRALLSAAVISYLLSLLIALPGERAVATCV